MASAGRACLCSLHVLTLQGSPGLVPMVVGKILREREASAGPPGASSLNKHLRTLTSPAFIWSKQVAGPARVSGTGGGS